MNTNNIFTYPLGVVSILIEVAFIDGPTGKLLTRPVEDEEFLGKAHRTLGNILDSVVDDYVNLFTGEIDEEGLGKAMFRKTERVTVVEDDPCLLIFCGLEVKNNYEPEFN